MTMTGTRPPISLNRAEVAAYDAIIADLRRTMAEDGETPKRGELQYYEGTVFLLTRGAVRDLRRKAPPVYGVREVKRGATPHDRQGNRLTPAAAPPAMTPRLSSLPTGRPDRG